MAARGGEQRGDGPLELAEVGDVDRERTVVPLVAEAPAHARRQRVVLACDAVALGLGPDVALHVGDPGAAHVEVEPAQRVALQPDAAADPVARLEHGTPCPRASSSRAATSPDRPAPITMTSAIA